MEKFKNSIRDALSILTQSISMIKLGKYGEMWPLTPMERHTFDVSKKYDSRKAFKLLRNKMLCDIYVYCAEGSETKDVTKGYKCNA
jgi:hypothetical protein